MGENCFNYFFVETTKIARYALPFLKNIDRMITGWSSVKSDQIMTDGGLWKINLNDIEKVDVNNDGLVDIFNTASNLWKAIEKTTG